MLFSFKTNNVLLLLARIFKVFIIILINTSFLKKPTFDLYVLVKFYCFE